MRKGMEATSVNERKAKIKETQTVTENVQKKQKELQEQHDALTDAGSEVQDSDLDDDVKNTLMEQIDAGLEDISKKSSEVAKELEQPLKDMDNVKCEAMNQIEESEEKLRSLEKFNIGGILDGKLDSIDNNIRENTNVQEMASEEIQKLRDLSAQLDAI